MAKETRSLKDNSQKLLNYAIDFMKEVDRYWQIEDCDYKMLPMNDDAKNCLVHFYKIREGEPDKSTSISLRFSYKEIVYSNRDMGNYFDNLYGWQSFLLTRDDKQFVLDVAPVIKEYNQEIIDRKLMDNERFEYSIQYIENVYEQSVKYMSEYHLDDLEKEKRFKSCCESDAEAIQMVCNGRRKGLEEMIESNKKQIEYSKICIELCDNVLASQKEINAKTILANDVLDKVIL